MDELMMFHALLVLNFTILILWAWRGRVRLRPLVINRSKRAMNPLGMLDGALPGVDFAIHCALYARGWGANYRLKVERLDSETNITKPCHLKVTADYIYSMSEDGTITLKRYNFDVFADRFSVKPIFDATLAKLVAEEDVEEVIIEIPKQA